MPLLVPIPNYSMYYAQALANPKPPVFIAELIGMPEDLASKVALVKKFQENLEGLETPTYGLLDAMFCDSLRANIAHILMPYWIDLSLTCYAHKYGLPYKENPVNTAKRVKDIATLFSGTRPTQIIPDMTTYDQKLLSMQNAKNTVHNPAAQQMRILQIKQYLSHEDAKWNNVSSSSTKTFTELWVQEMEPLVKELNELPKTFAGEPFLKTLMERIKALPTASHTLNPAASLWPHGYCEALAKDISLLKEEAQAIFKALPSHQRSLSQQIWTYKNLQEIKKYIGESLSPNLLQNLLLAQRLMMIASQGENQSDKLIKHFQSARALSAYAFSQQLLVEKAKEVLDLKAREILPLLSQDLHDLSIIGYDVIIKLLDGGRGTTWTDASDNYRKQLLLALNQGDLDNMWIDDNEIRALLSGMPDPASASLTQLYQQAKAYVVENIDPSTHKPTLNLPALTFEDPHIGLYGNMVPDALKDLKEEAKGLHASGLLGLPEQELYDSLLNRNILEVRGVIASLAHKNSEIDVNKFDSIIATIARSSAASFQRIERKQNFLFVLRKSADWKTADLEKVTLAAHEIINGTEGRCPDGQADFFQKWILTYILNNLQGMKIDAPTALKVSMSLWLQNYKSTFIERHTSPFERGSDEWTTHENRTAVPHLLTQMLRLPLSLVGSYSSVSYPSFAIHSLENPETALYIKAVMGSFLNGGSVTYSDSRITIDSQGTQVYHDTDEDGSPEPYRAQVFFPKLTLKTLGENLRQAFVDPQGQKYSNPLPGLLPLPQVNFSFPKEFIESFLQHDSILSSFYSTFIHSGYTKGNQFFDSQAAFDKGYHLQHVLKDAALLRLLEVGGYAKVPAGFYQNLPKDWKFE